MDINNSVYQTAKKIWPYLNLRRRKQLLVLLVITLISAVTEVVSIGAVIPFLTVLTNPSLVFEQPWLQPAIDFLALKTPAEIILPLSVLFALSIIVAMLLRMLLLYVTIRLSQAINVEIGAKLYQITLYQPYTAHITQNSGNVINNISNKANHLSEGALMPLLNIVSASIMLVAIIGALLLIDTMVTLVIILVLGFTYWSIIHLLRERLLMNSKKIALKSSHAIRLLQEGLGGIRDILLAGSQKFYIQSYQASIRLLKRAQGNNTFFNNSPILLVETIVVVMIIILAYVLTNTGEIVIPMLGALALGAKRLMPILQQLYYGFSMIKGSQASLNDVIEILEKPLSKHILDDNIKAIKFQNNIVLKAIDFGYKDSQILTLKSVNLTVKKGSKVGIIGKTGCGKSTLIDLIMALIHPDKGALLIDNQIITQNNYRNWQAHIAHVPQNIYLADQSIEQNIAFGAAVEKIDKQRIIQVAEQAQLSEFVATLANQYQTVVGERGIMLSGGQRQRIGIARALYQNANVLIFDEATSALDNETEQAIMKTIQQLNKNFTIFIIAHRLSSLSICEQIVKLGKDNITIGSYQQLIGN